MALMIENPNKVNEQLEEIKENFKVHDLASATWVMRKLRLLAEKETEIKKVAENELQLIQSWLTGETKSIQQERDFFTGHLESYHRKLLAEDSKSKTVKTPYGKLKLTKQQPIFDKEDEVIAKWAKANRPAVLIPQPDKLDWATLKGQLQVSGNKVVDMETGEVVPGVVVTARPEKFSVEVEI